MNAEDRKLINELNARQDRIETAIIGDGAMGLKGLLQRQVDDEKLQQEILQSLSDIRENQEVMSAKLDSQNKIINDHSSRLQILESFFKVWKTLGSLKRRTIIALGTLMAGATSVISFWEKIKSFIIHLFDK